MVLMISVRDLSTHRGVTKYYDNRRGLDGLDLDLAPSWPPESSSR
jgi:hypothetical protein